MEYRLSHKTPTALQMYDIISLKVGVKGSVDLYNVETEWML